MAEDEIIKHAKAAIKVVREPGKSWKHKIGEIIMEVLIIVFAVSVSIWFHNLAEESKDRKEEREFLRGLKEDLQADVQEMENDRGAFINALKGAVYFQKVGAGKIPFNSDSLRDYVFVFWGDAAVDPRISRFEALKGSGKLFIIESKDLLFKITDLYSKDFPRVNRMNDIFNATRSNRLDPYLESHLQLDAAGHGTNWEQVLQSSQMRLLVFQSQMISNSIDSYTAAIEKCKLIIKEIDKEEK